MPGGPSPPGLRGAETGPAYLLVKAAVYREGLRWAVKSGQKHTTVEATAASCKQC